MNTFLIALSAVAVLLVTAVPGFVLIKKKMLSEDCIPGFSKLLLYICQPALAVYTFRRTAYTPQKLLNMGLFALLILLIHAIMLGGMYLLLRKKCDNALYRIVTVACAFGNCAFFGIPILEALFPTQASELLIYTTVYAVLMNLIGWTLGSAIIARNPRYIRPKKMFLNPAMAGLVIAMPIFLFSIPLPTDIGNMVDILGKMCTPLSMIIMGMRLATVDIRRVFGTAPVYLAIAVKQLVMPLVALGLALVLPLASEIEATFFILCCCPVASIVLNFSEILGEGQKEAASTVLLGTILSILTLPVMVLLLPLL